ncbi:hypothetical protein GCG54_00012613 [Colletotrichum gloeosporioides]|uniref:Uncharacterized protein n=1 Tax=Colletotrichum gloeosporioides TaxID=474922 RepID=A0A8H4CQC9_COLGL|nr:uncharacterized protein GCG54_00012613 [Colletotrichum gloeosporioides]KAF3808034.1 hypothetical protein GCG54_00012613 [Colletotrichum gloeosporioides]
MPPRFKLAHLFPLFVAVAHTIGGVVPFFAEDAGIRSFGLPERFAQSTIAQACFTLDGARLSVLGMVQLIMYLRGDYVAVDIIMALLVYVGLVDGYNDIAAVPNSLLARRRHSVSVSWWSIGPVPKVAIMFPAGTPSEPDASTLGAGASASELTSQPGLIRLLEQHPCPELAWDSSEHEYNVHLWQNGPACLII